MKAVSRGKTELLQRSMDQGELKRLLTKTSANHDTGRHMAQAHHPEAQAAEQPQYLALGAPGTTAQPCYDSRTSEHTW